MIVYALILFFTHLSKLANVIWNKYHTMGSIHRRGIYEMYCDKFLWKFILTSLAHCVELVTLKLAWNRSL